MPCLSLLEMKGPHQIWIATYGKLSPRSECNPREKRA